ncbi:hypothetical protein SLUN_38260 [Streptomyces lunaelactis]|uniref:YcxB-like protein domain-containing protein n=1 Tax=Streptomyces lunaelactis TaxID=1535768 RepID=A0A2R4TDB9_9ACTN|nr:hypothetical protein [Streptomyces lunaelactis]AVZ77122.1 hypothetical protein SLUN_38260 [Streptomyces lunaelactis]NUK84524.1 hypothetical protein [Streptomyces lunaelactis]
MTESSGVVHDLDANGVVELRFELRQPDWQDAFRGRAQVPQGAKARLLGLLGPLLLVAAVFILSGNGLVAGATFCGLLLGLPLRRGIVAARQARAGAPLGPWTATVADSGDGIRFAGTDMEVRRGWGSLGGYVETAAGFVLLAPAPHSLVVLYLPKRALSAPVGIDRLRAILDRRLHRYGRYAARH